nr:retrotransposon protein, putative, Ty1-copia subclass [Tanacetum cinerariifolium]
MENKGTVVHIETNDEGRFKMCFIAFDFAHVAPTTAKQRLARKNELKARGTLLMALADKHQLKFNIHKDAKTLMEAIEKIFGGNKETKKVQKTLLKQQYEKFTGSSSESLDQILDRLQKLISQLEILGESLSQEDINLNTNEPVSTVASVSAASAKIPVSALPNVDTLCNAVECYNCHMKGYFAREFRSPKDTRGNVVAEPQRRNVTVKTSTSNALVSQCDGVGSYGWSFQAKEEPTNYALMAFTSSSSFSYDNEVPLKRWVSCCSSSLHRNIYATQIDLVFHDSPNVNETVHTAFNVELSPTMPDKELSHRPSTPIIEDWVYDSENDSEAELLQNAPDASHKTAIPKSHGTNRNRKACFVCKSLTHLIKHYDYYEKKIAQTPAKNHAQRGNHQQLTIPNPQRHVVPTAVLTKSNLVPLTTATQVTTVVSSNHVTRPRPAKTVVTKSHSPPRRNINRSPSPKASTFPLKVNAAKAPMVNVVKGVQGNCIRKPKCLILDHVSCHTSASMTLKRFDYNDALGRSKSVMAWVAFGGNPKGGKISGKGKIKTRNLDFDDVYFFKELKFNLFSVLQMCDKKNNILITDTEYDYSRFTWVFFLATKDETSSILKTFITGIENQLSLKVKIIKSDNETELKNNDLNQFYGTKGIKKEFSVPKTPQQNGISKRKNRTLIENRVLVTKPQNETPYELLLGRTPSIGFIRPFGCHVTILNTLDPLGKFDWKADEGFLVGYSNTDNDAAFGGKKPEFEGRKPESEVYVSPSSSAQTKKHDDKSKREDKGKSPIELSTGYRNLSVEFEDFSENSINEVNADDSSVPTVGQISTNSTNTFSAAGPSNADVSPTHGKSSYVNTSQYPDDLNMPELEDITYYDDEEDVGAEADFTNLETTITVSPIPTTKVHKDHPVTQIIGGAFSIQDAEVARIEAIRLFLAYASFIGFMVYQMDVKSAFLYGTIEEKVYVCQPPGFEDPYYPNKVYKVVKALYGLHQAPRAWYETLANYLLENDFEKLMKDKFQISSMGELTFFLGLQVKQKIDGIFISQDKYVADILRKFGLTDGKTASTPIDTEKPLLKDPNVAYLDSDYAGASLDKKSTTWGCQFLGCRLISWKCKKQTVVATLSTKAEYVAAVEQSSMKSLKRNLHVTNILSAGYLTTSQMVLNSLCLTNIKN